MLLALGTGAGLGEGELLRSLLAIVIVFGLLGALAMAARRGRLGPLQRKTGPVRIETTLPLGERRSLMVVTVEGRRLLLGLTPAQITLVTELEKEPRAFETALSRVSPPEHA
ncbi:MAG TPA: flagellar biosynthetic protein FliO [Vicinamibacterales bacterium]